MPEDYITFCEERLRCAWKEHRLSVPLSLDAEAAPEPYLYFGASVNPLFALTTNPGGTMEHQRRTAVLGGGDPLSHKDTYA